MEETYYILLMRERERVSIYINHFQFRHSPQSLSLTTVFAAIHRVSLSLSHDSFCSHSVSLSVCLKMAESHNKVFAAFWYSIIGRLLCTNSRKEDQKEEKSGVQIFDLQHFDLHSLSPHQPMSASLAFTTDAMRLLEEQQFLQLNKKEKDPLKPKQPMSAFFMFRNERRAESKCGWEVIEEWNNMTEKQKKPYEKIAKQNMEKYLEEMEAYKQRKEEESANPEKEEDEMMKIHKQEALELLKNKEKTKENRQKKKKIADPNKPKKKKIADPNKPKKKKIADPNKPKKPASSFLIACFKKQA